MSFSDSDWTRDPPLRPRMPALQRRRLILTIAIAVSCMALAIAVYGIEQLVDAAARSEALKRIDDVAAMPPPSTGPAPAAPVLAASAAAPSAAPLPLAAPASAADTEAEKLSALEAELRQRARETAQQAAIETAKRKERAWQRFYQRPDFCADNPTAAQMVQCANHHIRARKEFEERFAAGKS
jgi:type IV secretory pathway VirB10-like protein